MAKTKIDPTLGQAKKLYSQRRFSHVISLLNPQIFLFRTNPEFYTILGNSCLYMNDFGGAHTYLARAIDLDPRQIAPKLGLAVVYLRRGKFTESLQQWLDVLQIEPNNKNALFGLQLVRERDDSQSNSFEISEGDKKKLYPVPPQDTQLLFRLIAIFSVLGILTGVSFFTYQKYQSPREIVRAGGELLLFSSEIPRLSAEGDFEITLTIQEINELLKDITVQFDNFEDNQIRHEINRLLASNASLDIKTQMQLLLNSLRVPTFVDDFWIPTIEQVVQRPQEYRNVYIRWSGRIGNLRVNERELIFDFLVGYESGEVIDAIVPVRLLFPANLQAGNNVELIGQLLLNDRGTIEIQGSSIRALR
ncbi:MAG: hypothetical protein GW949_00800 [Spirochaetales bacterium]|nr:hypothetical protein [Spirochaetales bacterium]